MKNSMSGSDALTWINSFKTTFLQQREALGDLDRLAGDGDFADNIAAALSKVDSAIEKSNPTTYPEVFSCVSKGFLATGGTSGPLFGMWFKEIAQSCTGDSASAEDIAAGIERALAIVQKYGKAQVGDNTMVDAMAPAAVAIRAAVGSDSSIHSILCASATAARAGAESTRELIASKGRATYVGEAARGVLDPGAVVVAIFFESGAAVTE